MGLVGGLILPPKVTPSVILMLFVAGGVAVAVGMGVGVEVIKGLM
jgi:hypothetical protein